MARLLTVRQQQVYDFIQDRVAVRGYGPTVREIGEFLGIRSPNGVMCHLRALERKGMISRLANKSRAIEITNRVPGTMVNDAPAPLVSYFSVKGSVAKLKCSLFEAPQPFDVIGVLHRTERYLLQYNGNDLREYAIEDGDMLVVEPSVDGDARPTHERVPAIEGLCLVQCPSGVIELKIPDKGLSKEHTAPNESFQVIGLVVGVLRIHRPGTSMKPPHMLVRQAQRA